MASGKSYWKRSEGGCEHGKRPSSCSKCNLCEHGCFKPRCLKGCSLLCKHGAKKERCTECKEKCAHGKAYFCKHLECRLGICEEHSALCKKALQKSKCPWCHPGQRGKASNERFVRDAGLSSTFIDLYERGGAARMDTDRCEHDRFKFSCRECGKCQHGVYRPDCQEGCFLRCWHGKKPDHCATCNPNRCPHGKLLRCAECDMTAPISRVSREPVNHME
eukprot:jgi/Mesvir1/13493/Mv03529-RA.1